MRDAKNAPSPNPAAAATPVKTDGTAAAADEAEIRENPYYARVSARLRRTKYLFVLLTVATALLFLFAYRTNITYENLRYLLRDVDEAGNAGRAADSFAYTAADTNFLLPFRGDLAVCSSAGVTLYRAAGGRSFEDARRHDAPVAEASDKYMVVYDIGGTSYALYNSISRVFDGETDGPIYDCAVANGGGSAVLTRAATGGFCIRTYSKNFNLTGEITRSGYVSDIGYLDDGRLYICEVQVTGASLVTAMSLYTPGRDALDCTVTADGFAYRAGSLGDGFYLLTASALYFFDKGGEKTFSTSFATSEVLLADGTADGVAVYVDENVSGADCAVYAFFADGTSLSAPAPRGARSLLLDGRQVCLLFEESLTVYDGSAVRQTSTDPGGRQLLRLGDAVLVCYDDRAERAALH